MNKRQQKKHSGLIGAIHRCWPYLFRHSEWKCVKETPLGVERLVFDDSKSPWCMKIERVWKHPCGYIVKNLWLR